MSTELDKESRELLKRLEAECIRAHDAKEPIDREALLKQLPSHLRPELNDLIDGLAPFDNVASSSTEDYKPLEHAGEEAGEFVTDNHRWIGNYQVGEPTARPGGMGLVCLTMATDPLDNQTKQAAIKICTFSPELVRKIESRITQVRKIQHKNIVRIFDMGRDQKNPNVFFYVMEYIDAGDLDEKIKNGEFLNDPKKAAEVFKQLICGLAALHNEGKLLHGDIKPRNVLLGNAGEVKLADFDLSRPLTSVPQDDGETKWEGEIGFQGTPQYASPEQIRGWKVDETSDIYSAGVVFYEMLTRRKMVKSFDRFHAVAEVLSNYPERLTDLNPNIPDDLDRICRKCLEKEPVQRYRSATALEADLDNFLNGRPINIPPEGRARRWAWWMRKNKMITAALVTLTLLPLVAGVLLVKSNHDHESDLRKEAANTNRYIARMVAANTLFQLNQYSAAVVETAENPELWKAWATGEEAPLEAFLKEALGKYNHSDTRMMLAQGQTAQTFASIYVLNSAGRIVAITPNNLLERDFPGRDYFIGAMRHADKDTRAAVHVSRMFESHNDHNFKFALSVPFRVNGRKSGPPDGVIVTTLTANSTLGLIQLSDSNRTVALVLPYEGTNNPNEKPKELTSSPREYRVLLHPAYQSYPGKSTVEFPREGHVSPHQRLGPELWSLHNEQQLPSDEAYLDPVANDTEVEGASSYGGLWISGFAQVGNTEIMVVVQERYSHAVEGSQKWYWQAVMYVCLASLAALLIVFWLARSLYRLAYKPRFAV